MCCFSSLGSAVCGFVMLNSLDPAFSSEFGVLVSSEQVLVLSLASVVMNFGAGGEGQGFGGHDAVVVGIGRRRLRRE